MGPQIPICMDRPDAPTLAISRLIQMLLPGNHKDSKTDLNRNCLTRKVATFRFAIGARVREYGPIGNRTSSSRSTL